MNTPSSNTQLYRRIGELLAEGYEDQTTDQDLKNKIHRIRGWMKTKVATRKGLTRRGKKVIPSQDHRDSQEEDELRIQALRDILFDRMRRPKG
jgi:hypothetical protein